MDTIITNPHERFHDAEARLLNNASSLYRLNTSGCPRGLNDQCKALFHVSDNSKAFTDLLPGIIRFPSKLYEGMSKYFYSDATDFDFFAMSTFPAVFNFFTLDALLSKAAEFIELTIRMNFNSVLQFFKAFMIGAYSFNEAMSYERFHGASVKEAFENSCCSLTVQHAHIIEFLLKRFSTKRRVILGVVLSVPPESVPEIDTSCLSKCKRRTLPLPFTIGKGFEHLDMLFTVKDMQLLCKIFSVNISIRSPSVSRVYVNLFISSLSPEDVSHDYTYTLTGAKSDRMLNRALSAFEVSKEYKSFGLAVTSQLNCAVERSFYSYFKETLVGKHQHDPYELFCAVVKPIYESARVPSAVLYAFLDNLEIVSTDCQRRLMKEFSEFDYSFDFTGAGSREFLLTKEAMFIRNLHELPLGQQLKSIIKYQSTFDGATDDDPLSASIFRYILHIVDSPYIIVFFFFFSEFFAHDGILVEEECYDLWRHFQCRVFQAFGEFPPLSRSDTVKTRVIVQP